MKNKIYTPEARDREITALGRSLLNATEIDKADKLTSWLSAIDDARDVGSRATTARLVILAMVKAIEKTDDVGQINYGLHTVLSWLYYRKGGKA